MEEYFPYIIRRIVSGETQNNRRWKRNKTERLVSRQQLLLMFIFCSPPSPFSTPSSSFSFWDDPVWLTGRKNLETGLEFVVSTSHIHERITAHKKRLAIGLLSPSPFQRNILHLLSVDCTKTLLSASTVLSRLDYCNWLLSGCPEHLLEKLQKFQNSGARLVPRPRRRNYISLLLLALHWLPIQARIEYKLPTLCHSFFSDTAPVCLSDLFFTCTLHRDSSAPPLTQELYAFCTWWPSILVIACFPMPLLFCLEFSASRN